jgi:hypothetical protein
MERLWSDFNTFVAEVQEENKIFLHAIDGYLTFPSIFKTDEAFKILLYLIRKADYEKEEPIVFFSYRRLQKALRFSSLKSVQKGIRELVSKKLLIPISGKFEKEKAREIREEYFGKAYKTRSYNETNAYIISPALKLGLFLKYVFYLTKRFNIDLEIIEDYIGKIATNFEETLSKIFKFFNFPPKKISDIYSVFHSLPNFLNDIMRHIQVFFFGEEPKEEIDVSNKDISDVSNRDISPPPDVSNRDISDVSYLDTVKNNLLKNNPKNKYISIKGAENIQIEINKNTNIDREEEKEKIRKETKREERKRNLVKANASYMSDYKLKENKKAPKLDTKRRKREFAKSSRDYYWEEVNKYCAEPPDILDLL